jgi:hypothetical protein
MLLTVAILLISILAIAVAWAHLDAAAAPRPTPPSARPQSPFRPEPTVSPGHPRAQPARPRHSHPRAQLIVYGRRFIFEFEYQDASEGWRTYILDQPPYGARAQGGHESHRYYDRGRGLHFICIHEEKQPVATLAEARAFAEMWAKGTVRYIDTGQTF